MLVRLALIALMLIGAALATAEHASAGALTYGEQIRALSYVHTDDNRRHSVTVGLTAGGDYLIRDEATSILLDDAEPCRQEGDQHEALCAAEAVDSLQVLLGPAADRLVGGPLVMFACGGDGHDVLIGGSASGDQLAGGAGADDVDGGGGADMVLIDLGVEDEEACDPGEPVDGERLAGGPGPDLIEGGDGADVLVGGTGDDNLTGFDGDDRLEGGEGRDFMLGLAGNDALLGGAADDFLYGGSGNDDIEGGDGADVMGRSVRHNANGIQELDVVPAISTETGDDRFDGGEGDDVMTAGPGESRDDLLDPLGVAPGIDRSLASAELNGADEFVGGPGRDFVSYINRDRPVRVTLDGLADDGSEGERDRIDPDVDVVAGGARVDLLVASPDGGGFLFGDLDEDALVGGPGPDLMIGGADEASDQLRGGGGPDELRGGPGNDSIDGGDGTDLLLGGAGDDAVAGGDAADSVEGGPGADALDGGLGEDCLNGFVFPAQVPGETSPCRHGDVATPNVGADGADVLRGGGDRDRLEGGPGSDVADYSDARRGVEVALAGASAAERATFGVGSSEDLVAADVEGVRGGRGHDTLVGDAGDNGLDGGLGDDLVVGGGGSDQLRGGSGYDVLVARDGEADALRCGTRRDIALVDVEDELVNTLSDACERVDGAGSTAARRAPTVAPDATCAPAIRPPGAHRTFRLGLPTTLPWRSRVDASSCAVRVRGARGTAAHRRAVRLAGGAFELRPLRRGRQIEAVLTGGRRGQCGPRGPRVRRLDVATPPPGFSVRGRTRRATGPGATWTMIDGCSTTRVRVRAGEVKVNRLRTGRNG